MTRITIRRRKNIPDKRCFGELYLTTETSGTRFICNTLEDCVRPDSIKIPGQTAIPAGEYKLILDYSEKFKKIMPHILDVPGFSGIRIHSGNTEADTEGCILVGAYDGSDSLIGSRAMYDLLIALIRPEINSKGFITILIEDAF